MNTATRARLLLAAAIALTAALVIALLIGSGWARTQVLSFLSDELDRRVAADGALGVELSWPPRLRAENVRIANAAWSDTPEMVELDALEISIDVGALLQGRLVLPEVVLIAPRILLEISENGQVNWRDTDRIGQFRARGSPPSQRERQDDQDTNALPMPTVGDLRITNGIARYVNHANGHRTILRLDDVDGQLTASHTGLVANGSIEGQAFELVLEAAGARSPSYAKSPLSLDVRFESESFAVLVKGRTRTASHPGDTDIRFEIAGTGIPAIVDALLEPSLDVASEYRLTGGIRQRGQEPWQLTNLEVRTGQSRLHGNATLDLDGNRPKLRAELVVAELHADELQVLTSATSRRSEEPQRTPEQRLIDLSLLRILDAEITLRIKEIVANKAAITAGRITVGLEGGRLQVDAAATDSGDNAIAFQGYLDASKHPAAGRFTLDLGTLELDRTLAAFGVETTPPGTLSGAFNVAIVGRATKNADALRLPGLGRITIEPSQLRYVAPHLDTAVDISLHTETPENGDGRIAISAQGEYRGESFELVFTGDSITTLRAPNKPYGLDAKINAADTTVTVTGRIGRPPAFEAVDLHVAIKGPDTRRISPLIGFPLPQLPPYFVQARLTREDGRITLTDVKGRVGDSELTGNVQVEWRDDTPVVNASLESPHLDLDDLAGLIGATPEAGPGETASAKQREQQRREARSPLTLPRTPLALDRLAQTLEGKIAFRGRRVEARGLPLDNVNFDVEFDGGRLRISPLAFRVGEGALRLNFTTDTRERPFATTVEGKVRGIDLREVLAPFEIADDSLGILGGQIKLWAKGDSVADLLATADGGFLLVMTQGRLELLLIELAGLDAEETLSTLIGDAETVPIDCAYMDVSMENGIAKLETALADTSDTLFLADGHVDFREERLDIVVEPRPKDFSLLSLRSALHIEGRFKSPKVSPGKELIGRGAAVAALAAATPIAGLIPLIDPGIGEESAYCSGLVDAIDRARSD